MEYIKDASLVFDLPLYELDGSSFMSRDAYGRDCTDIGALWTPRGRTFDGTDDYLIVGAVSDFNFIHDDMVFSVGIWVKLTDYTAGGLQVFCDSCSGSSSSTGIIFYYSGTLDNIIFYAYTSLGLGLRTVEIISSSNIIADNDWHYVLVTGDGTNGALYVDGVVDTGVTETITNRADAGNTSFPLMIGAYNEAPAGGELTGSIGEFRIYSRCLNPLGGQHNYLATKERYK